MHLSNRGHSIHGADNMVKRGWEAKLGINPLCEVQSLQTRADCWNEGTHPSIVTHVVDLCNHRALYTLVEHIRPDVVIHYAEQPSAPYSMISRETAVETQYNNVIGTMNLLFALAAHAPRAHLIKLGSMGEYGTPGVPIEEGWINAVAKRWVPDGDGAFEETYKEKLPFPKSPGSFYHLSKVHDSHNIMFACKNWGLRSTDLMQGVVYGGTRKLGQTLGTSFHYDAVFGTIVNRFITQAACRMPLTVYGSGHQQRTFLHLRDTLQCVTLAMENPPDPGEYRVFNQFTEVIQLRELAERIAGVHGSEIEHLPNPRQEEEDHFYEPKAEALKALGLKPTLLDGTVIGEMLNHVGQHSDRVDRKQVAPKVQWAKRK
jgi:UDP-sulfoquinovose synthase